MRTEDVPMGRAYEALFALLWQALPYRTPLIGWRSDVEKATVEVCRKFFATYYAPNNIVIAIAGDFDTADALARSSARWASCSRPRRSRATPPRSPSSAASGARSCTSTCAARCSRRPGPRPRPAAPTARRSTCCR